MKKMLSILLCLGVLFVLFGCDRDNGDNNLSKTQPPTTSDTASTTAASEQKSVHTSDDNTDKYTDVSKIVIYKDGGMRYDITDEEEILKICSYYDKVHGELAEKKTYNDYAHTSEHTDREIRFFRGSFIVGILHLTNNGRYAVENGGQLEFYVPSENDYNAYINFFDEIFYSQEYPYTDVYTR